MALSMGSVVGWSAVLGKQCREYAGGGCQLCSHAADDQTLETEGQI